MCGTHWHDFVLFPPDDHRREPNDVLEEIRETRIEHIRLPGKARCLCPGIFPFFELLRRLFSTVEFSEFGGLLDAVHTHINIRTSCDDKHIGDVTLRRTNT